MLIYLILKLILSVIGLILLPFPTVTELPLGIDPVLSMAVSWMYGAIATLPYLEIVWQSFLWLLGFELAFLILKLFLGSRTPANTFH